MNKLSTFFTENKDLNFEITNTNENYFIFLRDEGLLLPISREVIEGWRGIQRDKGVIVQSEEWKLQRIADLEKKLSDLDISKLNCQKIIDDLKKELNIEIKENKKEDKKEKVVESVVDNSSTFWIEFKKHLKAII